jgi:hypothetical protein
MNVRKEVLRVHSSLQLREPKMYCKSHRRGASAVTVLVSVGVVIVLLLAAYFLVSKPFQTQVKTGYRQATEWTPENIQKDPVGYLTWALDEVGKTEKTLEASVISLKTKRNAAARALEKHDTEQSQYEKLLGEFKDAYKSASSASEWPVSVRDISFEEDALKRKVVECNGQLANTTKLKDTYAKTKAIIDRKLSELEAKQTELVQLKSKLSTDLELAKVNKSVEGIDSLDAEVNAIVDTSEALASSAEEGVSLDEMISPTGDAAVDDEFAKIMGEK